MPIGASSHLCRLVAKKSQSSCVAVEREVGERVGAVDEHQDAPLAGQPHDVADRQDLAAQVGDVGELDDARPRRDRAA